MSDVLYANSTITAHAALYMLTRQRIQSMVRAASIQAVHAVLAECGYNISLQSDDEIIDAERAKTFNRFMELCADPALAECVSVRHKFITTKLKPGTSLEKAEQKLFNTIADHAPKIKDEKVRTYFEAEISAAEKSKKSSDKVLFELAYEARNDLDTVGPLFYWYVLKQSEFKAVKIILMGKQLEFTQDQIMQDLRGIYDRF